LGVCSTQLDVYFKSLLTLSESSPPHQLRSARIFSVETRIASADANLKLNAGTCTGNSDTCKLKILPCADSNTCRPGTAACTDINTCNIETVICTVNINTECS
jgi:hypothetical protein